MIKLTSDEAQKLISKLRTKESDLNQSMSNLSTYVAAIVEDPNELRPDFDFKSAVDEIENLDKNIIKIQHAKNQFNIVTVLPDLDMTIDEALVRLSHLNKMYSIYHRMASKQKKERNTSRLGNKDIEYIYTNYEPSDAKEIADKMLDEIHKIQKVLNYVNSTVSFDVDIEVALIE